MVLNNQEELDFILEIHSSLDRHERRYWLGGSTNESLVITNLTNQYLPDDSGSYHVLLTTFYRYQWQYNVPFP